MTCKDIRAKVKDFLVRAFFIVVVIPAAFIYNKVTGKDLITIAETCAVSQGGDP